MKQTKFFKEYPRIQILRGKNEKAILNLLTEQFGITDLNGKIMQKGEERLFLFQGSLNPGEVFELEKTLPIERVGTYIGKIQENREKQKAVRLSIEGSQIYKPQITKNIVELSKEQAEEWMMGREVLIKSGKHGFVIIKYKDDFLGCGNASEEKITNFIPKNRRLKSKEQ